MKKIDLILINDCPKGAEKWDFGKVVLANNSVRDLSLLMRDHVKNSEADYFLFWNSSLGFPDAKEIEKIIDLPYDVWHCGLKLGRRKFRLFDFVNPDWMFNKDADSNIESSSYKLSLSACIIKKEVFEQLGFINPNFQTQEAAALELGYRYLRYGAFVRYIPWLVGSSEENTAKFTFYDELLFIRLHYKNMWLAWALFRSLILGYVSFFKGIEDYRSARKTKKEIYKPFQREKTEIVFDINKWRNKVSVIIPTLKRYPYLNVVLKQLERQTLQPLEVIVVDQTPKNLRQDVNKEFQFKLRYFYQENPGQCSSRNRAIREASGEYILFLDDDAEIQDIFIEQHAKTIDSFCADASSGVALEPGMEGLPFNFTYLRTSNVFPTNNTMIKKGLLDKTGLFDLAFEKGKRADYDLGMRVYLSGKLMVLNPDIKIFHHRALCGGLREYGQRRITRYLIKKRFYLFEPVSITEIYLGLKYFDRKIAKEITYIKFVSNFVFEGGTFKKLLRFVMASFISPYIFYKNFLHYRKAINLMNANA